MPHKIKLVSALATLILLSACSGMDAYLSRAAECDAEVAKLIQPEYETIVARVDSVCNRNTGTLNCTSNPVYTYRDLNQAKRSRMHNICVERKINEAKR